MRVRFLKDYQNWREGDTLPLPAGQARVLLKAGIVVISKDMTKNDYKQTKALDEEQANGDTTELRSLHG